MKFDSNQIQKLIHLTFAARDDDTIGCDGCSELMVEFAQAELDGREIPDGLKVVRAHIDQCRCCEPRYRALIDGLEEILP